MAAVALAAKALQWRQTNGPRASLAGEEPAGGNDLMAVGGSQSAAKGSRGPVRVVFCPARRVQSLLGRLSWFRVCQRIHWPWVSDGSFTPV